MATEKIRFTDQCFDINRKLVELMDGLPELIGAYYDNGFNSGGGDAIADADISASYNFTAAELGSLITVFEQLDKLLQNEAVTQGDYASSVNKIRFGRV